MSLGEAREVCEDVHAYLQPDGSWCLRFGQDAARQAKAAGLAPLEAARALGEMAAYHGGQPLTCHA